MFAFESSPLGPSVLAPAWQLVRPLNARKISKRQYRGQTATDPPTTGGEALLFELPTKVSEKASH
jgi:hypothetical protein